MAEMEQFQGSKNIPYFSTTMRDGFSVPMRQALFPAGLAGGAALILSGMIFYGLHRWLGVDVPADLAFFIAFGLTATIFFTVALLTWYSAKKAWMEIIRKAMLADVDQNGIPDILEQPAQRVVHRISVDSKIDGGSPQTDYLDLPEKITFEDFRVFCRAAIAGRSLAESAWTGQGGLWSKPIYTRLRDELLARNWVRWKNEKSVSQGVEPTPQGMAVFGHIARSADAPLP